MEDYGMLTKDGQPTERAKEIYISHCEEILKNGSADLPFSCVKIPPDPNAKYINLRDKVAYKSFHTNWVEGIYAEALRSINLESNISLPIFDPTALAAKLDGLSPPKLGFEGAISVLLATAMLPPPASIKYSLEICKVDPLKIPELIPQVLAVINPIPIPPIPPLPLPSVDFPGLSYGVPNFNLLDIKKGIFLSLPNAFLELFKMFSTPDFLLNFATEGPNASFSLACKALNKALPPPPGDNSSSAVVYQAAIAASLAKPLAVSTLGTVVGSSENGLTGGLGFTFPDPAKEKYYEAPAEVAKSSATLPLYEGLQKNTTPEFRKRLIEVTDEINANSEIGMNADWLVTVMESETGGRYDPALQNAGGAAAYGLIQIMPVALKQMELKGVASYTMSQVRAMSQVEQLNVVRDYYITVWKTYKKTLKNAGDLYVANFAPGFMGSPDNAVIYKKGEKGFEQNAAFQTGDVIIVGTVRRKLLRLLESGNRRGRISVDSDEIFPSIA